MNAISPVRVILADDHPVLLKGLSDIVGAETDFDVVGSANEGESALALIRALQPQLAVLDLAMPGLGGLDILKAIAHDAASPRVVILTALINDRQLLEAVASGVWGVLLKESAPEALVNCLREVAVGRRQLPVEMLEKALSRHAGAGARQQMLNQVLTARERDIAMLVSEGRRNVEIAAELGLSPGTVRINLHNMYTKLNIQNRTALAALVFSASEA